jgi:hypothetical protein
VEKAAEHPVRLPKMVGVRLRVALGMILGQIAMDNGIVGGYRVKNGQVEIVLVDPSEPGEDWISPKLKRRMLRPVAWDQDIPRDMPLAKILELVGAKYGEKITFNEKTFAARGVPTRPQGDWKGLKLQGESRTLMEILDALTNDVSEWQKAALWRITDIAYRVKPDGIELTAVERGSDGHWAILKGMDPIHQLKQAEPAIAKVAQKLEDVSREIFIEPKTPLADALEFLSGRFDLTLIVDTKAFEAVGIEKVAEVDVQLPRRKDLKVGTILQEVLDQIQADDWVATLVPHEDFIEVTVVHKNVKQKKPLTKKQLDDFWDGLAESHWMQPVLAAQTLAEFPEQAIALVREHVRPAVPPDPKKRAEAARWVKDLDSNEFDVRQKASEELEKLGKDAVPTLREQLQGKPPIEVRQRVEQLLEKLDLPPGPEQLREARAVHLLERIGTPEAERLLETLAKGTPVALTTEKAKAALERLKN